MARTAFDSLIKKVSSGSKVVSPTTLTVTVRLVCPAAEGGVELEAV